VGRYLTARSLTESRLGLLLNGLVKVPMQFLILLIGVMVFAFYKYNPEPIFFNRSQITALEHSKYKDSLAIVEAQYNALEQRRLGGDPEGEGKAVYKATIRRWLDDIGGDSNDTNYIFLRFVTDYLPKGLVGLLIAVIFLAAWGSISATLNSLSSCTIIDFHKRFSGGVSEAREYRLSRLYTFFWGAFCVAVAQLAYNLGNSLIEAVNVLGSMFYGVILGIFLVAFYRKRIGGHAVFFSALIIETGVVVLGILIQKKVVHLSFLWLNVIGAAGVVLLSEFVQLLARRRAVH
jgi:Na+/proline symporter